MELFKTILLFHILGEKGCMQEFVATKGNGLINWQGGWITVLQDTKYGPTLRILKGDTSEEFLSGKVKISIPQIKAMRQFIEEVKFYGDINFDLSINETPKDGDTSEEA